MNYYDKVELWVGGRSDKKISPLVLGEVLIARLVWLLALRQTRFIGADGTFDKVFPLAERSVAADMERVVNVSRSCGVINNR